MVYVSLIVSSSRLKHTRSRWFVHHFHSHTAAIAVRRRRQDVKGTPVDLDKLSADELLDTGSFKRFGDALETVNKQVRVVCFFLYQTNI